MGRILRAERRNPLRAAAAGLGGCHGRFTPSQSSTSSPTAPRNVLLISGSPENSGIGRWCQQEERAESSGTVTDLPSSVAVPELPASSRAVPNLPQGCAGNWWLSPIWRELASGVKRLAACRGCWAGGLPRALSRPRNVRRGAGAGFPRSREWRSEVGRCFVAFGSSQSSTSSPSGPCSMRGVTFPA